MQLGRLGRQCQAFLQGTTGLVPAPVAHEHVGKLPAQVDVGGLQRQHLLEHGGGKLVVAGSAIGTRQLAAGESVFGIDLQCALKGCRSFLVAAGASQHEAAEMLRAGKVRVGGDLLVDDAQCPLGVAQFPGAEREHHRRVDLDLVLGIGEVRTVARTADTEIAERS